MKKCRRRRRKRKFKVVSSSDSDESVPIIFNTDESNFLYSKRINRTNDFIGSKRVLIETLGGGDEKARFTVVFACSNKG